MLEKWCKTEDLLNNGYTLHPPQENSWEHNLTIDKKHLAAPTKAHFSRREALRTAAFTLEKSQCSELLLSWDHTCRFTEPQCRKQKESLYIWMILPKIIHTMLTLPHHHHFSWDSLVISMRFIFTVDYLSSLTNTTSWEPALPEKF